MRSFILIVYISLSVTNLYAQVPNQFSAGDAVSAEKINENFTYASKRLYIKNDNTIFGTIIEIQEGSGNFGFVVTSKNYFYLLLKNVLPGPPTLGNQSIIFSSSDCSGTAYINDAPNVNRVITVDSLIYYISSSTNSTSNVTYGSYRDGSGSCKTPSSAGSPTSRYALTTNNESITGFPNTIGTLSISYE